MSAFKGYLLKFGDVELPNSYIMMSDTNTSTPNQREEISAYRDENSRDLHRVTAAGTKTKQIFHIRSLTIEQMAALKAVMANAIVNEKQRKYRITYWNDEELKYKTGVFYVPDITYVRQMIIERPDGTYTMRYGEFELHIIEY